MPEQPQMLQHGRWGEFCLGNRDQKEDSGKEAQTVVYLIEVNQPGRRLVARVDFPKFDVTAEGHVHGKELLGVQQQRCAH